MKSLIVIRLVGLRPSLIGYIWERELMCIDAHTRDHNFASLGTT